MTEVLPENSFAERVRALVRLAGNKERLGRASGITPVMIGKYEAGSEPSRDKLVALAESMAVRVEWLVTGKGPMKAEPDMVAQTADGRLVIVEMKGTAKDAGRIQEPPTCYVQDEGQLSLQMPRPRVLEQGVEITPGYVRVPRYEIAASAGSGAVVQSEQVVDYLAFREDWLKLSLGVSPGRVAVISVVGDSMYPYLEDGDLVLVDLGVTRFTNDAVYILQYDDSLLVKRIQRKGDGTVVIKGDNRNYEPELLTGDAVDRLRVVGRMLRRLVR